MFPSVKIMVLLFFFILMFVCVCFKNTTKRWVSANFGHCFGGGLGAKSRVNNWAALGSITGTCGPIIDPRLLLWCLFFEVFFFKNLILPAERRIFFKNKSKQGNCGPIIDPTKRKLRPNYWHYSIHTYIHTYIHIYIHTYIYIYVVKLLSGPSLGFWRVIICAKLGLLSRPSLFLHYKTRGFRRFFFAQLSFCVFFVSSYLPIF